MRVKINGKKKLNLLQLYHLKKLNSVLPTQTVLLDHLVFLIYVVLNVSAVVRLITKF
jgi:hypothetical protein